MRKPKELITEDLRQRVFERDNFTCRYCGTKDGPFSPDHVYPESRGGATTVDNLVTACRPCNKKKHAKVGMWPKPIGYWDEHKKIRRVAGHELKQNAALIMISLFVSGTMTAMSFLFPNDVIWLLQKAPVFVWFGISVYFAAEWIVDFLRN